MIKPLQNLFKLKDKLSREIFTVGLDIGTSAVKLVKLKFFKEQVELCEFSLEPSSIDLGTPLKKITQSQNINKVNISVSGPATIIRYVNFPRMNEVELKQALKFEAQKHIPFSIGEVNLDSYILKEDLPDNKMLVLLAASKKEIINHRLKVMQDLGLKLNIVDIDSIALINAFNFNYSRDEKITHKTVALLNIGTAMSNLNILEDGIPRLSRDIFIAGNNLTQKLADAFSIDLKSAEDLKLAPDKKRAKEIAAAIESVLANLATEIRTSFDYYESQNASYVGAIFLSGGSLKFPGLKDMLANLLGIEVEYWNPFKQIQILGTIDSDKLKAVSGQLGVAVGLALRQ